MSKTKIQNGGILSLSTEHYEVLRAVILNALDNNCQCLTCKAVRGLGASIVKHNKMIHGIGEQDR